MDKELISLPLIHTCPYVQKYEKKSEYNRIKKTFPRRDAHVKSVIVFKSVDLGKDHVDTYFPTSHVTAM